MVAIRVLRERTALCRRMIGDATAAGRTYGVKHWRGLKSEADDQLRVLQRFLHHQPVNENGNEPVVGEILEPIEIPK